MFFLRTYTFIHLAEVSWAKWAGAMLVLFKSGCVQQSGLHKIPRESDCTRV